MDLATLTSQLRALGEEALPRIAAAPDIATLDDLDVAYLGRKGGALSGLMRGIGQLPADDRPRVGVVVNEVREAVEGALEAGETIPGFGHHLYEAGDPRAASTSGSA